jgi:hypothetical protein
MHIFPLDMSKQPMHIVFRLRDALSGHLEHVRRMRRLTMDASQPDSGLSGKYGLFGSLEWWNNIALGRMPLLRLSGKVVGCHPAQPGRDGLRIFDIRVVDGSLHAIEVHVADATGLPLGQARTMVSVLCALDELKRQPAEQGGRNVAKIALEMAIALEPVTGHAGLPAVDPNGSMVVDTASSPGASAPREVHGLRLPPG